MLAGEAIIIISLLFFGRNLTDGILTLNIVVSTIIYALYFIDIIFPMVNFGDKSHKTIGSLGIRWFITILYSLAAVCAMIMMNIVHPTGIQTQLIIHAILLFMLSMGIFSSISSSEKVMDVFLKEQQTRSGLEEMKKSTQNVQRKLEQIKNTPDDIILKMTALQDNLRYLSPCNNPDAFELEANFLTQMKTTQDSLFDIPIDYDKVMDSIEYCERTYQERKQLFSTKY